MSVAIKRAESVWVSQRQGVQVMDASRETFMKLVAEGKIRVRRIEGAQSRYNLMDCLALAEAAIATATA